MRGIASLSRKCQIWSFLWRIISSKSTFHLSCIAVILFHTFPGRYASYNWCLGCGQNSGSHICEGHCTIGCQWSTRMELISCRGSVWVRHMNGSIYGSKAVLWMKPCGEILKLVRHLSRRSLFSIEQSETLPPVIKQLWQWTRRFGLSESADTKSHDQSMELNFNSNPIPENEEHKVA